MQETDSPMSDEFLPFAKAIQNSKSDDEETSAGPVSVISPDDSEKFESFVPVLSGSSRSKVDHNHSEDESGIPKVTLRRQGDVVTHIEIKCTCGAEVVYECEYDGAPKTDAPESPSPSNEGSTIIGP